MALEPGSKLGPYEVLGPLGAGGMGEVYRARDTKLSRDVAIKVLPSEVARDPERLSRFGREATLLAALNHPHVAAIYGLEESDGNPFLVLELVEGENLAERLKRGPIPIDETLEIARQIADALEEAHDKGIVHRDLKPANVKLTSDGKVKVLDFGLAKAFAADDGLASPDSSQSPTLTVSETQAGVILGTAAYMSPEQARGRAVDKRADIWAFGVVLFEMLTGRRLFTGETVSDVLAAVLTREPAWSFLPGATPWQVKRLLRRCLERDPKARLRDVADARLEIAEASEGTGSETDAGPVSAASLLVIRVWPWVSGILAVALGLSLWVLAAGGGWAWRSASEEASRVVRSSLLPPEGVRFEPSAGAMVLSPAGTRLAFVTSGENDARMLWVRSLSALTAQPLAGTEGARFPFWSPDGRFIGFFSNRKLRKIDASGGPPQALCDATNGRGGTWGADGTVLFAPGITDVIHEVPASGGTPRPVTAFDESRGETSHRFPQLLPDGHHFLFLAQAADGTPDSDEGFAIFGASLGSLEKKPVVATNSSARYSASGHLLFVRDRTLVAQPFHPGKLELSGDAVPVAENMSRSSLYEAIFSVSDTGRLLYQAGTAADDSQLVWLDRDGREMGTIGTPADYRVPVLSHDQKRVAVAIDDPETQTSDLWVLDIERGTSTRLTFDPANDRRPLWSADDRTIYFGSGRSGKGDIYSKSSSGTGTAELVYGGEEWDLPWSLSSDGRTGWLISNNITTKTSYDIYRLDLESEEADAFLQTPFGEIAPVLSPDGRWLLYHSNDSGREQVFVQSLGDDGGKWQISTSGGAWAEWTRDGKEIVFRAADGRLMAVEVTLEPTFSAGIPEALFDAGDRDLIGQQYDVTPDGARFLVNRPVKPSVAEALTLVLNWTSELEQ